MSQRHIKSLYDTAIKEYPENTNFGTLDEFYEKIQDPAKSKILYDGLTRKGYTNLGSYESFQTKISSKAPEITADSVLVIPEEVEAPTETNLQKIMRALEEGRDNPQFIMSAMKDNDPIKRLNESISKMPKFAGLIPTDQITGLPRVQPPPTEFRKKYDALDDDGKYALYKSEVVKRKREKNISERDAWKEVYKETGKTPPGLLDLALEKSIAGGVLRLFGRDIGFDIKDYPEREETLSLDALEDFATGALSLVMPVDALLFAFGGGVGARAGLKGVNAVKSQVKQIGKFADEVALKISKSKKIPLPQARVITKNAVSRITGGAGGFGAFDAGRNIVDQIELTGEVDVVEATKAFAKGVVTGGTVGVLGAAGSYAGGKPAEFVSEVFGLGTVGPLLEGELKITGEEGVIESKEARDRYFRGLVDASGTIVGLRLLKQLKPRQQKVIQERIAEEIRVRAEETGQSEVKIANEIQGELKTAVQLAMEGKSPEKISNIEKRESFGKNRERLKETVERTFDRVNKEVKELAKDMDALEKAGTEQSIMDQYQNRIDRKIEFQNMLAEDLNIITPRQVREDGVANPQNVQTGPLLLPPKYESPIKIQTVYRTKEDAKTILAELDRKAIEAEKRSKEQEIAKDRALQKGYEPLFPSTNIPKIFGAERLLVNPSSPRSTENLSIAFHPPKLGKMQNAELLKKQAAEKNKSSRVPVQQLPPEKKLEGYQLQKEFSDLTETLRVNENRLSSENLTQREKLNIERSNERVKDLISEAQESANSKGIELQIFMGIPTPKILKDLFGSSKNKPKSLLAPDINKKYENAIKRLNEKLPEETPQIDPKQKPEFVSEAKYRNNIIDPTFFATDMVNRIRFSGGQTATRISDLARQAIDIKKTVSGQLSEVVFPAQKIMGSSPFSKDGRAVFNLSELKKVNINGQEVYQNKMLSGIEGMDVFKYNKNEMKIIELARDVIEARGKQMERAGLVQQKPDGSIEPFKVLGRNIAPRIMSPEFYSILELPVSHPHFKILIKEWAKANPGNSYEDIKAYFESQAKNFKGERGQGEAGYPTRTTQAEHSRIWSNVPHAIKIEGEVVPMVEHRPFQYISRLAETGSARIGVVKTFGQELNNTSVVEDLKLQFEREGGNPQLVHDLVKSISGVPVEPPLIVGRNYAYSNMARAQRGLGIGVDFMKNSALSISFFTNTFEPLGNVRKHAGMPGMLKSIFNITTNPKAVTEFLRLQGAITSEVRNFSIDRSRPFESLGNAVSDFQRRLFGFQYANEFQEVLAAQVYKDKINNKFKQGKGTSKDALLLRELDFTRDQAEAIIKGTAPQELYDAVIRTAASKLTGGAQARGEQSRLEQNKYYKAGIKFDQYAQTKLRSLVRSMLTYKEAIKEGAKEGDYKKWVDANRLMASEILGTAISGMTTQILLSLIYGGTDNLRIKFNEITGEEPVDVDLPVIGKVPIPQLETQQVEVPVIGETTLPTGRSLKTLADFAVESYVYSAFAGVYGSLLQSTSEGKLMQNPLELSFPVQVLEEGIKAYKGEKGRYAYKEADERFYEAIKRFFPVNRFARTVAVATGFGNPQAQKNDNAIRAYYRWKFKNKYGGRYSGNLDEDIKNFRKNMSSAYEVIKNSKDPLGTDAEIANDFVEKALNVKGKSQSSAISSIRARMFLSKSKIAPGKDFETEEERREDLKRTIGIQAYEVLEAHDRRLEDYIEYDIKTMFKDY
tara:strand:- start:1064 stop:6211 length:5148 start_codon:yes stop_codon:yes gene_type:complete